MWVMLALAGALFGAGDRTVAYRLGGIVAALLLLGLARQVSFGHQWARIIAWALLSFWFLVAIRTAVRGPAGATLLEAASAALAAVPILLLAAPTARAYFSRTGSAAASAASGRTLGHFGPVVAALIVLAAVGGIWGSQSTRAATKTGGSPAPVESLLSGTSSTAAAGQVYELTADHFAARFSSIPSEATAQAIIAGSYTRSTRMAQDAETGAYVECEDFSPALHLSTAQDIRDLLGGTLQQPATLGDMSVTSKVLTTFRGRTAALGTYRTSTGAAMTAVAVLWDTRRIYILVAASGSEIANLASSFVALA